MENNIDRVLQILPDGPLKDISITKLVNIDIDNLAKLVPEYEFKSYFLSLPGREHYRLLAYISTLYENTTLIDIGTYKGCSALALSYNKKNTVFSFDVDGSTKNISQNPINTAFVVDDILKEKYKKLIMSSPFILLDTNHNGDFEAQFHSYLESIGWKGILLLDDINLNDPMKEYWKQIKQKKIDMTIFGHWSGTGLVIFS